MPRTKKSGPIKKDSKRGTWYIDTKVKIADGTFKKLSRRGYANEREARYDMPIQEELLKQSWNEKLGITVNKSNETVKSIIDEYLSDYYYSVKPGTYLSVKRALNSYVFKYYESKGIKDYLIAFNEQNIIDWKKYISVQELCSERKNLTITHFNNIINRCIIRELLPQSARKYELYLKKVKNVKGNVALNYWTKEQYDLFLDTF
jgi:hypothetical protein